ncbi:hypothetical protein PX699_19340 [Sphingobium sp. H39-3-25]|uniref:hypothetical protein n=1 Tax=Sphingobium arseniciresistens TaxID=3030834 RepID=UPI0023B97EB4|nr:hypothetical protein [Sphingobium arseniciresistens]
MEAYLQATAIVISAILAVGGWLFNAFKDRQDRRFELRTKYRLEMLELCLEAVLSLNATERRPEEIIRALSLARSKIGIFGTDEEVRAFERLISIVEKSSGKALTGTDLNEFPRLLVANFRREIGLTPRQPALQPKD